MRLDRTLNHILSDYYRVPEDGLGRVCAEQPSGKVGFFRFGPATCYGQCESGVSVGFENAALHDALKSARAQDSEIHLPFDPGQIVENLRRERYVNHTGAKQGRIVDHPLVRKAYYAIRDLLPVSVRKHLQKVYLAGGLLGGHHPRGGSSAYDGGWRLATRSVYLVLAPGCAELLDHDA